MEVRLCVGQQRITFAPVVEPGQTELVFWVWDTVSLILNSRYNDNRTTIITSNYLDGPSAAVDGVEGARRAAREETLGDRIGERMRSRLFEMCRLVQLDGRDYRLRFRTAPAR
jgi:DNA replication protein DnaC